ncbi:serine hydrolase, partial [Nitrospirales bacterium NOB]|nr:serine hydrolase [Nitrospirales bacterium NOB]
MTHSDVIHAALQGAVDDGTFPGAVLAVRLRGRLVYEAAVGRLFVQPLGEPVTTETWYDLASLTKVLATTTALLLLVQRGEVALGDPIQKILPELVGRPCGSATIRQLLTHSSGLPGWRPYFERIAEAESTHPGLIGTAAARQAVLGYIGAEELIYEPTTRSLYSDLGFILLGLAVERVTRQPLDRWCQEQIFEPFHAEALSYLPRGSAVLDKPSSGPPRRIAATEVDAWRGRTLCGEVHDENAFALGGVAGHA